MGQIIHGSARTTEAVRRAIQRSQASLRVLARRHGINPKTVSKWRKRCAADGKASRICGIGLIGGDDTNSSPNSSTTENKPPLAPRHRVTTVLNQFYSCYRANLWIVVLNGAQAQ